MKSLDTFQKSGIILMGICLVLLPIQFIGILIFLHKHIGDIIGWIPLMPFLAAMGMIFYGILNALQYKWMLMLQIINCLLAWGNVYLAMQDGILL